MWYAPVFRRWDVRFQIFVVRRTPCTQAIESTPLVHFRYHKRPSPFPYKRFFYPFWRYDIREHPDVLSYSIWLRLDYFFFVLFPMSHLCLCCVPSAQLVQFPLSPDCLLHIRLRRRLLSFKFRIEEGQEHRFLPAR